MYPWRQNLSNSAILPGDWNSVLDDRLIEQMSLIEAKLEAERHAGHVVYPPQHLMLRALELTPLRDVRVVLLGQDPYHGPGQAEGLAFSVPRNAKKRPSVRNMLKELHADLGIPPVSHGCLEEWASQGVLLLNVSLSVRAGEAGSHSKLGWQVVTDAIIAAVSRAEGPSVFMLWGDHAKKKLHLIDTDKHLVIDAPHPSPLSARRGFFGSRPFSEANRFLLKHNRGEIDWQLSPIS